MHFHLAQSTRRDIFNKLSSKEFVIFSMTLYHGSVHLLNNSKTYIKKMRSKPGLSLVNVIANMSKDIGGPILLYNCALSFSAFEYYIIGKYFNFLLPFAYLYSFFMKLKQKRIDNAKEKEEVKEENNDIHISFTSELEKEKCSSLWDYSFHYYSSY